MSKLYYEAVDLKDEDEAFAYWQEVVWYGSGQGYEGVGRCFGDQVDMFNDWLEDQKYAGPNMNLQD